MKYSDECVGAIFARGGSKGLPDKNVLPSHGKPLIGWAIEHALGATGIDRVIVSTDSIKIADVARQYGAEVPFLRPDDLASDNSPEWLSWQHLIQFMAEIEGQAPAILVSVPTTSPLRKAVDVENCLDTLRGSQWNAVVTLTEAARNPYFNMVRLLPDGEARIFADSASKPFRRQDCPQAYDITTVAYAAFSEFILRSNSLFEGKIGASLIPPERAVDIDSAFDFAVAEILFNKSMNG